jgi:hypothetical protein
MGLIIRDIHQLAVLKKRDTQQKLRFPFSDRWMSQAVPLTPEG